MAYASLQRGLGAEASGYQEIAERCTAQLKNVDWNTKAGREYGVKLAAECAGEGICAYFSSGAAPPAVLKLCGSAARKIVGPVIDAWNDIFGNAEEWAEYYARQAIAQQYWRTKVDIRAAGLGMSAAMYTAAARLIDLHDRLMPDRKGLLGGGKIERWTSTATDQLGRPVAATAVKFARYPRDVAAKRLLLKFGMPGFVHRYPDGSTDVLRPDIETTTIKDTAARTAYYQRELKITVPDFFNKLKAAEMKAASYITAERAALQAALSSVEKETARRRTLWFLAAAVALTGTGVFVYLRRKRRSG